MGVERKRSGDRSLRRFIHQSSVLQTLNRKQFLHLIVQQFLSLIATYAISFASVAFVVDVTGSGVQTAFTILSVVVPGLLFGLIGGVTVDRVSRRTMLIVTNVLRGIVAIMAPLGLSLVPDQIVVPLILAVNFVLSAVGQFNFPAEAALIPYMVPTTELLVANSAFNISYLAAIGVGSGIWGPLTVRFFGAEWAYFVAGLLFLATLYFLFKIDKDRPSRDRAIRRSRYARLRHLSTVIDDVYEGLRFTIQNSAVAVAILGLISQTALALGMVAVFPVVLNNRFGVPVYNLPLFLLPGGLGAGIGLLVLLSPLGNKIGRTILVVAGNILITIGLLFYTIVIESDTTGLWWLIAASPTIGWGFVMAYVSAKSVLQEEPPDYLRGRVISLQLTLNNVVSLLPTVLAGWVFDQVGATPVFVASTILFGITTISCGAWVWRMHSRYPA